MPRRLPDSMSWHVSGPAVRAKAAQLARSARGTESPESEDQQATVGSLRAQLLARRRRRLGILVALAVLSALLVVLGVLPFLLQVLVDLVLVAYLIHLRTEARRAAELSDRRPLVASRPARSAPPARAAAAPRIEVEVLPEEVALERAAGGAEWSPVPVPPPSYVTKSQVGSPEAPQTMVDLTHAGSNLMDELGLWNDLEDDDTQEFALFFDDDQAPRRRAVND